MGSIYIENSNIAFNEEQDRGFVNNISNIFYKDKPETVRKKIKNLNIRGKNISVQTDISGTIFNLDRLFIDLDFTDETLDFSLKTRVNSQKIRYIENTGPFSSEITVQGYFDRKDSILNYNVELKNLKQKVLF